MIQHLSSRAGHFIVDAIIIDIALCLAYLSRYDGVLPQFQRHQLWVLLLPMVAGVVSIQILFGIHKHKWRYVTYHDAVRICEAYAAFSLLLVLLRITLPERSPFDLFRISLGVIATQLVISVLGAIAARAFRRSIDRRVVPNINDDTAKRILLLGVGIHAVMVANEMLRTPGICVIGFVDDDPKKVGSVIAGVPVFGPVSSLKRVVEAHKVDEVLICIPPGARKPDLDSPENLAIHTRIVPTLDDILSPDSIS